MAKFLIADDHPLFREALISALGPLFENVEIIQSDCLDSTLEALQQNSDFDLVLLDLNMPGCESFYGLTVVGDIFGLQYGEVVLIFIKILKCESNIAINLLALFI